jgi:hypothetical protein
MERDAHTMPEPDRGQRLLWLEQARSIQNLYAGLNMLGNRIDEVAATMLVLAQAVGDLVRRDQEEQ